ncbi:MAG: ABC-F family ATP-binding cassette domain-containing protein [Lachnospiraceae bacterium]|nr:ABC-F family ATP-binding cassette domain-containing protein [Lachnospiraceae bacterium]
MILNVQNITKAFADNIILNKVSFIVEEREKVAIVGINGSGKSTLLKCIVGEYEADSGQSILMSGKTLGYLAQQPDTNLDLTIYQAMEDAKSEVIKLEQKIRDIEKLMKGLNGEELENAMNSYTNLTARFEYLDGYKYKSEIIGVLKGLKFSEEDYEKPVSVLSGGQKTRVELARLLLSHPDIIILDEPTNHLDIDSIAWLEQFLSSYNGAVLIVSHDRYFLDKVVTKVIDIDAAHATTFSGNYSAYADKKAALRLERLNAYEKQQNEIKHQEEVIDKLRQFNREKSIKRAESRVKKLDKMERLEKPKEINSKMRLSLTPSITSGNDVLMIEDLSKSFDNQCLFRDTNLLITRGEKVAIIGKNGTGKTTLLKIINKELHADNGRVRLGTKVKIGYYDQASTHLTETNTVFDEISDAYPDLDNTRIRNVLAAFLFTGDDVFKLISSLSGGERGRVSLAKLMLSNANLLILDEPTNHLDIESKEILEDALRNYEGTVFYVSHDRYFVNRTATRILELENQHFTEYKGNYDYYIEKKLELKEAQEVITSANKAADNSSGSKADWKAMKEEQANKRKKENAIKKVEAKIADLEKEIAELDNEMADPAIASNSAKLFEISTKRGELDEELNALYSEWEELSE